MSHGLLFFGFGFAFAFYALVDLDPDFASIILATGPLLTLLFAVAHGQETLRLSPVIGSLSAALAVRAPFVVPEELETWTAMAYMVVFGSVVLFNLAAIALKYWDASRVAYILVLMPIVAVLLSVWMLDEKVGVGLIGGGLLVLTGVYIGALRRSNPGT